MEKKAEITRREFLKDSALAGAGAAVLGGLAPAQPYWAAWRLHAYGAPMTAFASACWEAGSARATT